MTHENMTTEKFRQTQEKLILKLLPTVRISGFQNLRMDDIAKIMDISRATLYKYFPNKEDLFQNVVYGYIQYIKDMTTEFPEEELFYALKFQQIFEQSVSLALLITDDFLKELQITYPLMYEKLWESIQLHEEQLLNFYNQGMEKGVFNEVSGKLLILQDKMLFSMLDLKYLMNNQLTIEQVLLDFYNLRKIQLFKPEMFSSIEDALIVPKIKYLTQKISNILL